MEKHKQANLAKEIEEYKKTLTPEQKRLFYYLYVQMPKKIKQRKIKEKKSKVSYQLVSPAPKYRQYTPYTFEEIKEIIKNPNLREQNPYEE